MLTRPHSGFHTHHAVRIEHVLGKTFELEPSFWPAHQWLAHAYLQRRMYEEAFSWLQKAAEQKDPYLITLGFEPLRNDLRADPRFRELLRTVGLEEP